MLMTILGVAGCTGLLVMGFGIRDSLHGIGNIQYSEVQKNDVIALKNRHVNTTERQKLNKIFTSHDVTQTTAVQYQQLTKHLDSTGATENVMLIAPQSTKNFFPAPSTKKFEPVTVLVAPKKVIFIKYSILSKTISFCSN